MMLSMRKLSKNMLKLKNFKKKQQHQHLNKDVRSGP
nr:MAG TPA: hypothetical protein [Caudoviricetes sp.]